MESTGCRRTLGRLLPHPAVVGAWLTSLLAAPLVAGWWALHPSHLRAGSATGAVALALVGTIVLGSTVGGATRLPRLGLLIATGTTALISEYVVAYAVVAPNQPGADDAAAVGAMLLSASLLVLLGALLGVGVALRAIGSLLAPARAKPPPRPDAR